MSALVGVRDEAGVAEALAGVEQRELGARVRALPSTDEPGALRPGGEIDEVGELDHPRALPASAVEPRSAGTQSSSWASRRPLSPGRSIG